MRGLGARRTWLGLVGYIVLTAVFSAVLLFFIELIVRGTLGEVLHYFQNDPRAAATTVAAIALCLWIIDGIFGRSFVGAGLVASAFIVMAIASRFKELFLGAPLYPTDFVFVHQIFDLFPLLAANKLLELSVFIVIPLALFLTLGLGFLRYRRARRLPLIARVSFVGVAVCCLAVVGANLNYRSLSSLRIFLGLDPMVWDQEANYRHNGFLAAFAMNVPMAIVSVPPTYSQATMKAIHAVTPVTTPADKPDIIMVMVESLWDITRLDKVTIRPDPIPTIRRLSSGSNFSPEFGGLTANIEFEALTGFSDAFLPDGSIPYQQYVRHPMPSLASFLDGQGYVTRALHPYKAFFWNRGEVYRDFGFDEFRSEEKLPPLKKRGPHVADSAFADEIIREADKEKKPFFFFAVTIQNHGPYAPDRYKKTSLKVTSPYGEDLNQRVLTYAEGALDADRSLVTLVDWAKKRKRHTILVMFGDHAPPLGDIYKTTGFLHGEKARGADLANGLKRERETPLVIWSNRSGAVPDLGPISPAFIPLKLLQTAGMTHPYYTGFLGTVFDKFPVVERRIVLDQDGGFQLNWLEHKPLPPELKDFWLVEHDQIFGADYAAGLFPGDPSHHTLSASADADVPTEAAATSQN